MATNADTTNGLSASVESKLSLDDLTTSIKAQGDLVRKLKAEKAPEAQVQLLKIKMNILNETFD